MHRTQPTEPGYTIHAELIEVHQTCRNQPHSRPNHFLNSPTTTPPRVFPPVSVPSFSVPPKSHYRCKDPRGQDLHCHQDPAATVVSFRTIRTFATARIPPSPPVFRATKTSATIAVSFHADKTYIARISPLLPVFRVVRTFAGTRITLPGTLPPLVSVPLGRLRVCTRETLLTPSSRALSWPRETSRLRGWEVLHRTTKELNRRDHDHNGVLPSPNTSNQTTTAQVAFFLLQLQLHLQYIAIDNVNP
jgi:hypothetical protein